MDATDSVSCIGMGSYTAEGDFCSFCTMFIILEGFYGKHFYGEHTFFLSLFFVLNVTNNTINVRAEVGVSPTQFRLQRQGHEWAD